MAEESSGLATEKRTWKPTKLPATTVNSLVSITHLHIIQRKREVDKVGGWDEGDRIKTGWYTWKGSIDDCQSSLAVRRGGGKGKKQKPVCFIQSAEEKNWRQRHELPNESDMRASDKQGTSLRLERRWKLQKRHQSRNRESRKERIADVFYAAD